MGKRKVLPSAKAPANGRKFPVMCPPRPCTTPPRAHQAKSLTCVTVNCVRVQSATPYEICGNKFVCVCFIDYVSLPHYL